MSERPPVVPFLNIAAAHAELRPEIDAAIARVIDRGHFVLGREVAAFEMEFARYVGADTTIAVGNGLDALALTLRALDIGPGDEVIVPGMTFVATWLAVLQVGATPVGVEPNPATFTMDPAAASAAITARTRAIMPVHLYGRAADMSAIGQVAHRHGIPVIADAAQAHGACHREVPIGAFGLASCWSFYPGKNLGALGDGGAITTSDPDLADRLRLLRNYGSRVKYEHEIAGVNSRLDEIQAAVLRVKLARLDAWNARRRALAERYDAFLSGVGIDGDPLWLPGLTPASDSVHHLYVVRSIERDELRSRLAKHGVETLVHYPVPPHLQAACASLGARAGALPITEQLHREVLSLPMGPHLTDEQQLRVVDAVWAATKQAVAR